MRPANVEIAAAHFQFSIIPFLTVRGTFTFTLMSCLSELKFLNCNPYESTGYISKRQLQSFQYLKQQTAVHFYCGTGVFFLAAYDYIVDHNKLDKAQSKFLKYKTFFGNEIVASTRRLALMNLFLHNIGD